MCQVGNAEERLPLEASDEDRENASY